MESPVFIEQSAQSIRKTLLSAPELARAGIILVLVFGVAPGVYYIRRVKGLTRRVVGQVGLNS